MTNLWRAPHRGLGSPIHARITIPGSKSVTNRALILAALADSPSLLRKPLHSRDSALMIGGLKALGVGITEAANGDLEISPAPLFGPAHIDVGNAGTVMRFLPPVAAMARGILHFDGDPRSHERPLGPVIAALESLGVSIEHGGRYALPMTMNANGQLEGGVVDVDATSSSQFISALLLVAPATKKGITIRHTGSSLPSMPHIEMTVQMLREVGVTVEIVDNKEWRVSPSIMHGRHITIEPDLSNAAPFIGAAMICGGSVTVTDWPEKTTQPGDQLRTLLAGMGANISFTKTPTGSDLTLTSKGEIHGIDVDLHDVGELTPSIAALAVLADSPSSLRGIGHLRLHETDRLAAIAREVNSLGGNVVEEETALHITPAPLHEGIFHTYDDHRLATAGAMIGLRVPGIEVENISTTQKTLPDFPGAWADLLSQNNSGSVN
jgi:3-phosphoshikimate 1-carboxyvinyltransferase